jgi:hypothetical protein
LDLLAAGLAKCLGTGSQQAAQASPGQQTQHLSRNEAGGATDQGSPRSGDDATSYAADTSAECAT